MIQLKVKDTIKILSPPFNSIIFLAQGGFGNISDKSDEREETSITKLEIELE